MKRPSILIVTNPSDSHALAVAEGLRRKGAEATLWFTSDYPTRGHETIEFEDERCSIEIGGPTDRLADKHFDSVWNRRPAIAIDEDALDPADHQYAQVECKVFRQALFSMLAPNAFWVNRRDVAQRAALKPWQHQQAVAVGFNVPNTIYTNDPQAIRRFIRDNRGAVAFKPLLGQVWESDDSIASPVTARLCESDLVDDRLLRQVPAIYQAMVPKAYELRVTVMGRRFFSAQLLSQQTENGKVDWRQAAEELTMRPYQLPAEVRLQCLALMERMGLVYGCFDFIVTPDGKYVFLEVNQAGQFLFIDDFTGMPLLDAFCEFLMQARPDFSWSEDAVDVTYEGVYDAVDQALLEAEKSHVATPSRTLAE